MTRTTELSIPTPEQSLLTQTYDNFPNAARLIMSTCATERQYAYALSTAQQWNQDYIAWQTGRLVPNYIRAQSGLEPTGMERYLTGIYDEGEIVNRMIHIGKTIERSVKYSATDWSQKNRIFTALIDNNGGKLFPEDMDKLDSVFGMILGELRMEQYKADPKKAHVNSQYRDTLKRVTQSCVLAYPQSLEAVDPQLSFWYTLPGSISRIEAPSSDYYKMAGRIGQFGHPIVRATLVLKSNPSLRYSLS